MILCSTTTKIVKISAAAVLERSKFFVIGRMEKLRKWLWIFLYVYNKNSKVLGIQKLEISIWWFELNRYGHRDTRALQ